MVCSVHREKSGLSYHNYSENATIGETESHNHGFCINFSVDCLTDASKQGYNCKKENKRRLYHGT